MPHHDIPWLKSDLVSAYTKIAQPTDESLYHEALHHQMHTLNTLYHPKYLSAETDDAIPNVKLSWRARDFDILEALHALHVYSYITPLRFRILSDLQTIGHV